MKKLREQAMRGHNIVADEWALAANPHPHPTPHLTPSPTQLHLEQNILKHASATKNPRSRVKKFLRYSLDRNIDRHTVS